MTLIGRYQLQVLYHNTRTIVDLEGISGSIVCRSDKLPLVVSPTVIEMTGKQRRSAQKWITALEPAQSVKVVALDYRSSLRRRPAFAHPSRVKR